MVVVLGSTGLGLTMVETVKKLGGEVCYADDGEVEFIYGDKFYSVKFGEGYLLGEEVNLDQLPKLKSLRYLAGRGEGVEGYRTFTYKGNPVDGLRRLLCGELWG